MFIPKVGQNYWVVDMYDGFNIQGETNENDSLDRGFRSIGNCFKTREEARQALKKIKQILKNI